MASTFWLSAAAAVLAAALFLLITLALVVVFAMARLDFDDECSTGTSGAD
jgi:hypothetical protein